MLAAVMGSVSSRMCGCAAMRVGMAAKANRALRSLKSCIGRKKNCRSRMKNDEQVEMGRVQADGVIEDKREKATEVDILYA